VKLAIYPGTFDPITNGHLNIVEKASGIFPKVVLAVARDTAKKSLFSLNKRFELCTKATKHLDNVEVEKFSGLIVDFAQSKNARILIRGLRAVSDFEYELQQSLTNRKLNNRIETVFLLPDFRHLYLSSSIVRQVFLLGGDLGEFVPQDVKVAILEKNKLL